MKISPSKLNTFLLFKLPIAYISGVRVKAISENTCEVSIKHRWINQNPFKSMFWAVQGMAAELTTGALLMQKIRKSDKRISMLVANNKAAFTKKATGRITFTCTAGEVFNEAIAKAIKTGDGQTVWVPSEGVNEDGITVSTFQFQWTIKVKA